MWTTVAIAGKPADVLDVNPPRFAVLFLHDLDQKTLASSPTKLATAIRVLGFFIF